MREFRVYGDPNRSETTDWYFDRDRWAVARLLEVQKKKKKKKSGRIQVGFHRKQEYTI